MILTGGVKGLSALLWLGYAWVLARVLEPQALGTVLFGLGLAGLAGGLAAAGWAQMMLREGARTDAGSARFGALLAGALRAALRGGVLATGAILAGAGLGLFPLTLIQAALAGLAGGALSLTAALAAAQRAQGNLIRAMLAQGLLKASLPLSLSLAWLQFDTLSATSALALFAGGTVLAAMAAVPGLGRPRYGPESRWQAGTLWRAQAGWLLFSHLDLLAAGALLAPETAAVYLVARRIAALVAHVFDALRLLCAPHLAKAFAAGHGQRSAEIANALAFRFGGGAAVLLLAAQPVILPLFGPEYRVGLWPAIWLIAAQAAPAVFGVTGLAMTMANLEAVRCRLILVAILPGAAALALAAGGGAVGLAATAAALHWGLSAAAALILFRRFDVRPGPALLV